MENISNNTATLPNPNNPVSKATLQNKNDVDSGLSSHYDSCYRIVTP